MLNLVSVIVLYVLLPDTTSNIIENLFDQIDINTKDSYTSWDVLDRQNAAHLVYPVHWSSTDQRNIASYTLKLDWLSYEATKACGRAFFAGIVSGDLSVDTTNSGWYSDGVSVRFSIYTFLLIVIVRPVFEGAEVMNQLRKIACKRTTSKRIFLPNSWNISNA